MFPGSGENGEGRAFSLIQKKLNFEFAEKLKEKWVMQKNEEKE